ncbi:MAG: Ig-like domain-containing protein [Alloprevotella sp.]|nr:Ig-like domain-containing protein [Alloprevotella sp.]
MKKGDEIIEGATYTNGKIVLPANLGEGTYTISASYVNGLPSTAASSDITVVVKPLPASVSIASPTEAVSVEADAEKREFNVTLSFDNAPESLADSDLAVGTKDGETFTVLEGWGIAKAEGDNALEFTVSVPAATTETVAKQMVVRYQKDALTLYTSPLTVTIEAAVNTELEAAKTAFNAEAAKVEALVEHLDAVDGLMADGAKETATNAINAAKAQAEAATTTEAVTAATTALTAAKNAYVKSIQDVNISIKNGSAFLSSVVIVNNGTNTPQPQTVAEMDFNAIWHFTEIGNDGMKITVKSNAASNNNSLGQACGGFSGHLFNISYETIDGQSGFAFLSPTNLYLTNPGTTGTATTGSNTLSANALWTLERVYIPTAVTLTPSASEVTVGNSITVGVDFTSDKEGTPVTEGLTTLNWASSDNYLATVAEENGSVKITGMAEAEEVTITATSPIPANIGTVTFSPENIKVAVKANIPELTGISYKNVTDNAVDITIAKDEESHAADFTVVGNPANADFASKSITWTITKESVESTGISVTAKTDAEDLAANEKAFTITATDAGTYTVTPAIEGLTDLPALTVTVNKETPAPAVVPATGITLTENSAEVTLTDGTGTATITGSVDPSTTTETQVTFSSSSDVTDLTVAILPATLDDNKSFTATVTITLDEGKELESDATVEVTLSCGAASTKYTITVKATKTTEPPVEEPTVEISVPETPAEGEATIATTAPAEGEAEPDAFLETKKAADEEVEGEHIHLTILHQVETTVALTATAKNVDEGTKLIVKSSNEDVATGDIQDGRIVINRTGALGTAVLTVEIEKGGEAKKAALRLMADETSVAPTAPLQTIHVEVKLPKDANVEITGVANQTLAKNGTAQLSPKAMNGEKEIKGAEFTYRSSDEKVATVDETGKVTAVGYGDAKITVTYGEVEKEVKVTVKSEPTITGIEQVNADAAAGQAAIYDLSGRRLTRINAAGVYIVNSVKTLVR